jgi:hypothetical protein
MAHAAKQVMIEDHNAKKLLGLSQVIEKWITQTLNDMNNKSI